MAFFAFLGSVFPWKLSQNARHFHDYYQGNVFQSITRIYIFWFVFLKDFPEICSWIFPKKNFLCSWQRYRDAARLWYALFLSGKVVARRKCLRPFPGCASNHLFLTMTELQGRTLRNFLLPSKHQLSLLISVLVGTLQRWAAVVENKHNSSILVSNDASKTASIALCTNIPIMSTNNTITWGKIPNTIY